MRRRGNTGKDVTIGIMLVAILTMAIGYAILQQRLNVEGTAQIKSDFNIQVVGIREFAKNGAVTTTKMSYTAATATYAADVQSPGDNVIYEIIIENKGTLSGYALIGADNDNTNHSMTYSESLNVGVWLVSKEPLTIDSNGEWIYPEDASRYTELASGEKLYVYAEVYFDENATSIPNVKKIENTLKFDFTQTAPVQNDTSRELIVSSEMLYLEGTNAFIKETGIENTYDVTVTLTRIDNSNVEPSDYSFSYDLLTSEYSYMPDLEIVSDFGFTMVGNSNITTETKTMRIKTETPIDEIMFLSFCGDGVCAPA